MRVPAGANYDAEPALLAIPAPYFLTALEYAVRGRGSPGVSVQALNEINRHFETRGIWFRMTRAGLAEWHGDEAVYKAVVAPALDVLADPRLGAARREFEDALRGAATRGS